ncbi:hypothetical protein HPP92_005115 [Vanilla planifolia]|uniref:phosphoenolpyruvate carboxykinase (ATP) n=1 Tax=Vanilla planifolia TaxID=51239 RepID=A0A835RL31_VANPL|nr:hypothetical protein HPP92_005115 [Vanilla planifolia]
MELPRALLRSFVVSSRARLSTCTSLFARTFAGPTAFADDDEGEIVMFSGRGTDVSYGLNWALVGKGVVVKDKAYYNLKIPELMKLGACIPGTISDITLYMRGNASGGPPDISKAQFLKLLKQVTSHISSVRNVFIQDGVISSSPKSNVTVRIISDSPSALLPMTDILWKTPARAVSHDPCPLTVYVASSISKKTRENLGLGSHSNAAFAAADIDLSSLIFCGNAFADVDVMKDALFALATPIIFERGGLPLFARIVVSGNWFIILFAHEDTIKSCPDLHCALVSMDAGAVLCADGVAPFFRTKELAMPNVLKGPSAVVFASSDSTGGLLCLSKLSPGQAAYHYLAGFHDGKFLPGYINGASSLDPLVLAFALHKQLKENETPSFLINVNAGGKHITGADLLSLVDSSLSSDVPKSCPRTSHAKVVDLKWKYNRFLSGRFKGLPEEFSF